MNRAISVSTLGYALLCFRILSPFLQFHWVEFLFLMGLFKHWLPRASFGVKPFRPELPWSPWSFPCHFIISGTLTNLFSSFQYTCSYHRSLFFLMILLTVSILSRCALSVLDSSICLLTWEMEAKHPSRSNSCSNCTISSSFGIRHITWVVKLCHTVIVSAVYSQKFAIS